MLTAELASVVMAANVAALLAVNFMSDPKTGVREMRRAARPGGVVTGCVWVGAGLGDVEVVTLRPSARYPDFDDGDAAVCAHGRAVHGRTQTVIPDRLMEAAPTCQPG